MIITSASTDRTAHPDAGNRMAFLVLATVQATLIFTITLINVPLPQIAREFSLTSAQLLLVLAAYGLPFSGLLLFGGRLADRFGGRALFVIGQLVFGLSSVGAALAADYEMLVTMRFAQGVGAALTAPAAMAILRRLYPASSEFGRAMAVWGGVSVLGSVLGFMISGVVTSWISWRWMFVIPVAVAILGLTSARPLMPGGRDPGHGQQPGLDLPGAFLATLAISLSSFGLIQTGDHAWNSPEVLWTLGAGIVFLIAFMVTERFMHDPLLPPGFLWDRHRLIGLLGMLMAAAAAGGLVSFVLSLFLQQIEGWGPLSTTAAFLPFAIALMLSGRVAPALVGRFGAARITITGLLIAAIGLILLALLERNITYLTDLMPGMILLAVGGAFVFAGAAVLSTDDVPPHQAGLAGGVMNTAMELGPTVGLATLMSVAALQSDPVVGFGWAFGTAAAAFLLFAFAAHAITRRPRPSASR